MNFLPVLVECDAQALRLVRENASVSDGNPSRPLPASAFARPETYAATRLPVDLASTLVPDAYVSPEFHAFESESLFARSWVPVCVTDEVAEPGSYCVVDVAGRSLIVCRNRAGELRAHHNV